VLLHLCHVRLLPVPLFSAGNLIPICQTLEGFVQCRVIFPNAATCLGLRGPDAGLEDPYLGELGATV